MLFASCFYSSAGSNSTSVASSYPLFQFNFIVLNVFLTLFQFFVPVSFFFFIPYTPTFFTLSFFFCHYKFLSAYILYVYVYIHIYAAYICIHIHIYEFTSNSLVIKKATRQRLGQLNWWLTAAGSCKSSAYLLKGQLQKLQREEIKPVKDLRNKQYLYYFTFLKCD